MPSPADRTRVAAEWLARATGIIALGLLLWSVTRPVVPPPAVRFEGADLDASLAEWTRRRPADSVHLELAALPDARSRAWLLALRRTGIEVTWRAPGVSSLVIAAEPLADPRRRARVSVAAPGGAVLAVRDAIGLVDTLTAGSLGASMTAPLVGRPGVHHGTHHATALATDSAVLRRVLVLGAAGWESRFVIAALEETGWSVDARIAIGPGAVVRQGAAGPIDTARYSAVVALDALAAADARAIGPFVRAGGGVVLAGAAAREPALARLAPGRLGPRWRPAARTVADQASLASLAYYPLRVSADDAVILDERDGGTSIAAQRVGSGRVIQVGYDETWRWRMAGGDEGPGAHRAWWGGLVGAAAFTPRVAAPAPEVPVSFGDAAPLASLVAVLGPPRAGAPGRSRVPGTDPRRELALFTLALLSFLGEWASRRLRGAA